jgi:hypothetical protein
MNLTFFAKIQRCFTHTKTIKNIVSSGNIRERVLFSIASQFDIIHLYTQTHGLLNVNFARQLIRERSNKCMFQINKSIN